MLISICQIFVCTPPSHLCVRQRRLYPYPFHTPTYALESSECLRPEELRVARIWGQRGFSEAEDLPLLVTVPFWFDQVEDLVPVVMVSFWFSQVQDLVPAVTVPFRHRRNRHHQNQILDLAKSGGNRHHQNQVLDLCLCSPQDLSK